MLLSTPQTLKKINLKIGPVVLTVGENNEKHADLVDKSKISGKNGKKLWNFLDFCFAIVSKGEKESGF